MMMRKRINLVSVILVLVLTTLTVTNSHKRLSCSSFSLSLASNPTKQVYVNYFANERVFLHMRTAQDDFPASNMCVRDFAKQRGINESTFNHYRRNGFPLSWDEAQQQGRGTGRSHYKPGEAVKIDAFVNSNIDYENNAALNKAFKRDFPEIDFPEITDSRKRGNRLTTIKRKIAKIKAKSDGLNAAVSANASASASASASDVPFDAEESDFV